MASWKFTMVEACIASTVQLENRVENRCEAAPGFEITVARAYGGPTKESFQNATPHCILGDAAKNGWTTLRSSL